MQTAQNLHTNGAWSITDGTDTLLPATEGAVQPGQPFTMAFCPAKAYRQMYTYRPVPLTATNQAVVQYKCRIRFQDLASVAACQQLEFDTFNMYFQGQQYNGGLAARFVGQDAGYWHYFDVSKQAWEATSITVPPSSQLVAGITVEAWYWMLLGQTAFETVTINGWLGAIGKTVATRPTTAQDGIFTALQLDAQQTPAPQTVIVDEIGLTIF